jgi:lysophospholipase L1-like esterase
MRDFGVTSPESDLLNNAVQKINDTFKIGVKELSREDQNFEGEIAVLKKNMAKKKSKKELLVFYGSSTLRLWKNVAQDFPRWDTLNLGFGGAFIHSLNDYFEELFRDVQPKVIVLYLGGNDLTLGFTASKIVAEIVSFIDRVQAQFPNTKILNISIKPSFERQHDLKKIKEINAQLGEKIETLPNVYQVDFYESLLKNKRINEVYFLQDGLHLSAEGYQVLRKAIDEKLDHLI